MSDEVPLRRFTHVFASILSHFCGLKFISPHGGPQQLLALPVDKQCRCQFTEGFLKTLLPKTIFNQILAFYVF